MEGWVKLYRQLLESAIFKNERLLKVCVWCLLKASYKQTETMVGNQLVILEKGQFIFGREEASKELGIKESTLYKDMKKLEKLNFCNIKSNNKFSVITIEKWEFYQDTEENENGKNNNNGTTTEHKQEYKEYIYNNKLNNFNNSDENENLESEEYKEQKNHYSDFIKQLENKNLGGKKDG